MTAHPIDTEALRRLADAATPGPWEVSGSLVGIGRTKPNIGQTWGPRWRQDIEFICAARTAVPALLDALAAAEHRATRAEAQSAIRGRAVVIYRERGRKAEAERDWNIRSSRNAKRGRIQANARADQAEAKVSEEKVLLMKAVAAVTEAEAGRDEWRQIALDERAAALDALEQIKVRDARIKAVRDAHRKWTVGDPCDKRQGCGGADCAPHVSGHGDKVWRHWRDDCAGCAATWPCPTVRALDGDA